MVGITTRFKSKTGAMENRLRERGNVTHVRSFTSSAHVDLMIAITLESDFRHNPLAQPLSLSSSVAIRCMPSSNRSPGTIRLATRYTPEGKS
jgi:hypothetical protein